ncbi:MAG: DUF2065 domain-containing protein [Proteobacteria bacterium]|nr:DUF2065 domain-containing protein [Pseudomonadota bacterium]MCL2307013.1 DUF2065 domain-containing protein [Pseudomonadota bacterium]
MKTLALAIALLCILEGLLPFLAPAQWREIFRKIIAFSDGQLRFIGLISIVAGVLLWVMFQ